MTSERDTTPLIDWWLHQTIEALPNNEPFFEHWLDELPSVPQRRHRWWHFGRRQVSPAPATSGTELQPALVPATNGHAPTVTGRTTPTFSATKFVVAGVIVALFGGFLLIAQPFDQQGSVPGAATGDAGTFSPTGSMAQPRAGHSATLLSDGRVLIVGGEDDGGDDGLDHYASAEVWDPDTDTFSPTGSLADGRAYHSATLLPDGRVLVVGGEDAGYGEFAEDYVTSAEVWDPSTGGFSSAGSPELIAIASTTLLNDGRVLVVGRVDTGDGRIARLMPVSAKVWDPATDTFSAAGLDAGDDYNAATALADGRVLLTNDEDPTEFGFTGFSGSAVVWDPVTDTVSPAGSPGLVELAVSARSAGSAQSAELADGRVLVIGWLPDCESDGSAMGTKVDCGRTSTSGGASSLAAAAATDCRPVCISWAEIWDPDTTTFGPAGLLPGASRERFTVTALADGGALIAGGCSDYHGCYDIFDSAEVWDPDTETFGPTGEMAVTRFSHTATALPDGRVLVVGGLGDDADAFAARELAHASAEVWEPGDR